LSDGHGRSGLREIEDEIAALDMAIERGSHDKVASQVEAFICTMIMELSGEMGKCSRRGLGVEMPEWE
jgi:hypothetical protein